VQNAIMKEQRGREAQRQARAIWKWAFSVQRSGLSDSVHYAAHDCGVRLAVYVVKRHSQCCHIFILLGSGYSVVRTSSFTNV